MTSKDLQLEAALLACEAARCDAVSDLRSATGSAIGTGQSASIAKPQGQGHIISIHTFKLQSIVLKYYLGSYKLAQGIPLKRSLADCTYVVQLYVCDVRMFAAHVRLRARALSEPPTVLT